MKRQFLIVWASCVPGRFPDYQEDAKNNHRLYYMTTRDFKRFSETKLFYDPGFSAIDATLVKRGPKDYVMVVKDNSRPMRNLKVAFADSPYGPWSEASEPFTESFTEGPSTARVGDWWYIYYDSYQHGIYGAHRTKDFKSFQDQTGAVSFPVGHKHGTVFMAPEELVDGLIKYNKDVVHYSGLTMALTERHDGGLKPVVGVHSIQTMRGEKPWTYNHQPMLAYWNGKFYMHYLTDPRHEHEAPGKTMMQTSADGYTWTQPVELFPEYPVPEGWTKENRPDLPPAHNLKAVMHQRVGWYEAQKYDKTYTTHKPHVSHQPHHSQNPFLQPVTPELITLETFDAKTSFRQSNKSRDFIEGDDEQQEISYIKLGSVLHELFSTIRTTSDIGPALQQMELDGILYDDDVTREKLTNMLHKRLEGEMAKNWFSERWKLFNECSILQLNSQGEMQERRPDRVMTDGKETHVVDFKFGSPKPAYKEQVREYMELLRQMGMPNVKGWLWYVYSNKIEEVKS